MIAISMGLSDEPQRNALYGTYNLARLVNPDGSSGCLGWNLHDDTPSKGDARRCHIRDWCCGIGRLGRIFKQQTREVMVRLSLTAWISHGHS
jgi:hypothetical protein